MKKILPFLFLITASCLGQRTFNVTQGELAFIHPKEGIILFKDNKYLKLEIKADIVDNVISYDTVLSQISNEKIKELKAESGNIYARNIFSIDVSKLDKLQFIGDFEYNVNSISYLNKECFILKEYTSGMVDSRTEPIHYFYVKLGNKTIIQLFDERDGFIVNNKDKFVLYPVGGGSEKYSIKKKKVKLLCQDVEQLQFDDLYRVDTLAGKVGLQNYFREWALPAKYDSIFITRNYLTTYLDEKVELYNATLNKLRLKGLRAARQEEKFPYIYILQKNNSKKINVLGGKKMTIQWWKGYGPPDITYSFNISKESDVFYIESPEGFGILYGKIWKGGRQKLYNTHDLDSIYLWKEEIYDHSFIGFNQVLVCKMKNGKFKLEYLINFLVEHPETSQEQFAGNRIIGDFDSVEDKTNYLKIVKDGLIGYFPFNKTVRYKEIEEYHGFSNYIRFTLPDGKKGWLDINGKEYLDIP